MYSRIALCAALLVPVGGLGLTSHSSEATKPIVISDTAPVEVWCPEVMALEVGPLCFWRFRNCDTGQTAVQPGPCEANPDPCSCDEPVMVVRLSSDSTTGSAHLAVAGPHFDGLRVASDCYRGSAPEVPRVSPGFELVIDMPVRIGTRAYRLLSLVSDSTGERYDFGVEIVGTSAKTIASYPEATVRVQFGSNALASVAALDGGRVFAVRGVGDSSVRSSDRTPIASELIPIPDNTVPVLHP